MHSFRQTPSILILPSLLRPLETSGQLAESRFQDSSYTIFHPKTIRVRIFGRKKRLLLLGCRSGDDLSVSF